MKPHESGEHENFASHSTAELDLPVELQGVQAQPHHLAITDTTTWLREALADAVSPHNAQEAVAWYLEKYLVPNKRFQVIAAESPMPDFITGEIARLFKQEFDEGQWGQYAILLSRKRNQYPRVLQKTEALRLTGLQEDAVLESGYYETSEGILTCFHDPKRVVEQLREKFSSGGHLAILADQQPHGSTLPSIVGYTFGYKATLRDAFRKEWEDPFVYAIGNHKQYLRSYEQFQSRLAHAISEDIRFTPHLKHGQLDPDMPVFVWNCVNISGPGKGGGNFWNLVGSFFASLPPDIQKMVTVGETLFGSHAHKLFQQGGAITATGTLERHAGPDGQPQPNDLISVISRVSDYSQSYIPKMKI